MHFCGFMLVLCVCFRYLGVKRLCALKRRKQEKQQWILRFLMSWREQPNNGGHLLPPEPGRHHKFNKSEYPSKRTMTSRLSTQLTPFMSHDQELLWKSHDAQVVNLDYVCHDINAKFSYTRISNAIFPLSPLSPLTLHEFGSSCMSLIL